MGNGMDDHSKLGIVASSLVQTVSLLDRRHLGTSVNLNHHDVQIRVYIIDRLSSFKF